jgi:hypothetical protein
MAIFNSYVSLPEGKINFLGPKTCAEDAFIRTSESLSAIVEDYGMHEDKWLGSKTLIYYTD